MPLLDDGKKAAESVGDMASHATAAVGAMANKAACDATKMADDLTAKAGAGIHGLGDQIAKATPHEGMVGSASQAVARTVKEGGEYLEHAKLSGMTEDIAKMVQRNPIPAVFLAIGLGWIVARSMRN